MKNGSAFGLRTPPFLVVDFVVQIFYQSPLFAPELSLFTHLIGAYWSLLAFLPTLLKYCVLR